MTNPIEFHSTTQDLHKKIEARGDALSGGYVGGGNTNDVGLTLLSG
jgi:hypothetical protein